MYCHGQWLEAESGLAAMEGYGKRALCGPGQGGRRTLCGPEWTAGRMGRQHDGGGCCVKSSK